MEEQEAILKRAERFDRLQAEPGWTEIMEFLAEDVNNAIIDAATCPVESPEIKTVHVTRWDAKRQLMDAARNYIAETLRLRDEIMEDRRINEHASTSTR